MTPVLAAGAGAPAQTPDQADSASAISLLPNGSVMQDVMLPRYDEQRRLTSMLKARKMTIVTDDVIAGEDVTVGFFNSDNSPGARVDMITATLHKPSGLLEARRKTTISSERVQATGTALAYSLGSGEGFLTGPAATVIQSAPETTMNSRPTPRGAAAAAALLASSGTMSATPPAPVSPQQQSAIAADAAPAAPAHARSSSSARERLRDELDASAAATAAATAFLEQTGAASAATQAPARDATPLEVQPGPADTLITCDGGIYFDADAGVLVYLRNVRVTDPRFSLSGAGELKVFLGKKPAEPAGKTPSDKQPAIAPGAGFGDVERIVATGAVRFLQKQPEAGKEPVEASGAIFTYHPKTGEIILTGGYPWVKQGSTFMRARQPNLSLRIQKSGSFVTEGNWDMGGKINQIR